ncbi:MAG: transketolase C-terminal domain-containing protein, partial [Acidobacteriota bacterium]
ELHDVEPGRGEILSEGGDVCLLAYGSMVPVAVEAASLLAARGVSCGVANARFAKPLDKELLARVFAMAPRIVTVEEHLAAGGFGSGVLEAAQALGLGASRVKIHAVPDQFVEHSPQAMQRKNFGLDPEGIAQRVLAMSPELARSAAGAGETTTRADEKLVETVSW